MECSNNDIKYLEIAAEEANKSPVLYRHGCVAVASGKIIAKGYNHLRTISRDGLINNVGSCHAEIDVLRKCLKLNIKQKISLYIVRIGNNNNNILSSFPCGEFYKQMQKFDIKSLIYSESDGIIKKIRMRNFESTHISSGTKALHTNRLKVLQCH